MKHGPATCVHSGSSKPHLDNRRGPALIVAGLLCLLATGCFRPSNSVQSLRDTLHQATGEAWNSEIELGVGALTMGVARAGGLVVELPPEAHAVLRSVRGADVGVYRLRHPDRVVTGATVLRAADRALTDRGWDRLAGIIEGHNKTVAIYVSHEPELSRRMKLCLVVVDGPQMVIVAARGNPEPLLKLALAQAQPNLPLASSR